MGRPVRRAEGPAVRHAVGPSEAGPGGGPPRVAAHRRLREIRSARAARVHQVSPAHRAGRAVLQGHAGAASHGRAAHSLVSQPRRAGGSARAHASGHASGHQARARRAGAGVSFLARIRAAPSRGGLLRVRLRALALRSWRGDVLARAVLLHLEEVLLRVAPDLNDRLRADVGLDLLPVAVVQVDGLQEHVVLAFRPRFTALGNRVRLARLRGLRLLHGGVDGRRRILRGKPLQPTRARAVSPVSGSALASAEPRNVSTRPSPRSLPPRTPRLRLARACDRRSRVLSRAVFASSRVRPSVAGGSGFARADEPAS
mmetsp:Transcript_739/g.2845  ORF Transcript_739/g.2845 Transcript_739/m.2845 type:complete len:314 (-) Transcript_739:47-988(-)